MNPIIVYLDMDGVLCDFDALMLKTFNRTFDNISNDSSVKWDIISSALPDLYSQLDVLPDAEYLVASVTELCDEYGAIPGVLTAIPKYGRIPLARQHKYEYIEQRRPLS